MCRKLPVVTFIGIWGLGLLEIAWTAQFGPPHSLREPESPQALLEKAIVALESRRSTAAQIRHRVHLFGRNLVGSGDYLEQRTLDGLQFRLALKTQLGEESTSLLQVCDGQYLWTYRKGSRSPPELSRIAVLRVAEALEEMGAMPEMGKTGSWLGLGGLPKIVRGLNAAFQFASATPTELDHKPVWKLVGQWKPEKIARLVPGQEAAAKAGKPVDFAKLPAHVPDQVILYLGREDLFPYQIEYLRKHPNPKDSFALPTDRIIVAMELFDVRCNVPIHPTRFLYHPGNLDFTDQTESYLRELGLKR